MEARRDRMEGVASVVAVQILSDSDPACSAYKMGV